MQLLYEMQKAQFAQLQLLKDQLASETAARVNAQVREQSQANQERSARKLYVQDNFVLTVFWFPSSVDSVHLEQDHVNLSCTNLWSSVQCEEIFVGAWLDYMYIKVARNKFQCAPPTFLEFSAQIFTEHGKFCSKMDSGKK